MKLTTAVVVVLLFVSGCAGPGKREARDVPAGEPEAIAFLADLDRLVDQHGARDASRFPMPGFPYLRIDRFLEAMQSRLDTPDMQRHWVEQMRQADLESRRKEIDNLPLEALAALSNWVADAPSRDAVYARSVQASNWLLEADLLQDGYYDRVKKAVDVPDEYSTAMRVFLLYPIAALPVSMATSSAYGKYRKWHSTPPEDLPVTGVWTRFAPRQGYRSFNRDARDRLFMQASRDAFGLPEWTAEEVAHLAEMFAPVITQDVAEDYDRFGAVGWHQERVTIDHDHPLVYYYLSHAFTEGEPVVQMNYALWYSERAGENAPSIERGPLDGLTFRITFDSTGAWVMADVMNNCGCYHFFIPDKARVAEVIVKEHEIEPLVPAWLPEGAPPQRIDLRVNSGWHQVQHVGVESQDNTRAVSYSLMPYSALESLPSKNGARTSAFNAEGIMKDSWRIEPYIFFSMGIPKVGYMRQRGHHAIKMVGREHFSNPYLFDRNFIFRQD
jgi:hypothetical protein